MRPLPLRAAALAVLLAAPAAHADMVIIQQGHFPGPSPFVHHMPQGSAFGMAEAFIRDMAAERFPQAALLDNLHPEQPRFPPVLIEEAVGDPITFSGEWSLIEVRGLNGDMLVLPQDRIETTQFIIDEMGLFDASAGCNPISGVAALDDGLLSIEAELEHQMMCFVGMEFEYPLEVALNATAFFAQGPETLVLLDAEGNKLARFSAR